MKKIIIGTAVLFSVLFLSGCGNFALPESLSLRSKANYNFTVANKSFDLKEYFSISSLVGEKTGENGEESSSSNYNIYDYNPNGNSRIQQFLLQMDVQEIPLDFGSYLSQADFSTSLQNMSIDKDIEVPEVDISEEKEIEMSIDDKINNLVTFSGVTATEAKLEFEFSDVSNNFESITYRSGYMTITTISDIKDIDVSNPGNLNLDSLMGEKLVGKVKLLKNNIVISEAEFKDGIASLPLDNVSIEKKGLTFAFDTKTGVQFYGKVNSDSVIQSVAGLSLLDPVDNVTLETTISLGNDSDLESCEIDEGTLKVVMTQPKNWTGVNMSYTIDLKGALDASFTDTITQVDLAGKSFSNADIDVKAVMSIVLNNATIDLLDSTCKKVNPVVTINSQINKIKSAIVKLSDDYNAKVEQSEPLSDEILSTVNEIIWNRSGIEISYTNTLPEGNDMAINMTSGFLGFNNDERQILHTEETETKTIEYFCDADRSTKLGKEPGEFSAVDVIAELNFPNYDADKKVIKVQNVVPGKKYKLALEIKPVFDWNSISISSSLSNQKGVINAEFNLSSIFKGMEDSLGIDMAKCVEIKTLPLYLFCDIPNVEGAFEDPKFKGTIKAFAGDDNCNPVKDSDGNVIETYLLGGDGKSDMLPSLKAPELNPNENKEVTIDLAVELNKISGYEGTDISKLITTASKTNSSLCIDYDVEFVTGKSEGITISSESIEKLNSGSTSIKLSAMAVFSLEFKVISPIEMNLIQLSGKDTSEEGYDLLGRQEATSLEDYQKFIDIIETVSVIYKPSEIPFDYTPLIDSSNEYMKLVIDLDGDGTKFSERSLSLKGDVFTENPSSILSIYPLNPKLDLVIPVGNLSIPREMKFSTKVDLRISTNGQVKVWDKYETSKGGN